MGGFAGDAAEFYARYRRGYPTPVVDMLVDALALGPTDSVLDLGCGTGQLTIPLARRVGRIIGVDPEPDMLALARAAQEPGHPVRWVQATTTDLPAIALHDGPFDAITLANVIHLVDRGALFADARTALSPGGRLAVIANGTPLWLQESEWSQTLRRFLETRLGVRASGSCGTDTFAQQGFARELAELGWGVEDVAITYSDTLTGEQIIGGVFSALSERVPMGADRNRFTADCLAALAPHAPFDEQVRVHALVATAAV